MCRGAPSWADPATAVHLAPTGPAIRSGAAAHVRASGGGGDRTGAGGDNQSAAPEAPPIQGRWDRTRDCRGRSAGGSGCKAADDRGGDSHAQGELVIGPSGNVRVLV